jgi:hypothetical protein
MSEKKVKNCPFNNKNCDSRCALFIATEDLNELLAARLASLGVLDKKGTCSLKTIAMSAGRYIFENTSTKRF